MPKTRTKNFMPSVGRIKTWRTPEAVDGLRIDAGYRERRCGVAVLRRHAGKGDRLGADRARPRSSGSTAGWKRPMSAASSPTSRSCRR